MNKKYLLAISASTLMLAACGDDVTEIHQDGMAVLEAGLELSKQKCDSANVGEMLFVMDSSEAFICDGESWQTLKGEKGEDGGKGADGKDGEDGDNGNDGTSCTAQSVKNAAGLGGLEVTCGETVIDTIWNGKDGGNGNDGTSCTATMNQEGNFDLVCGGQKVGTIMNGKDGQDGADGEDGNDGASCTAKSVKNAAGLEGLEVTCGGAVVDTIWNGEKGETGKDGAGCSIEDGGNGKVTVTCGEGENATTEILYKAMCGTKPYDPLKSFCSEGELYELCGGKSYDPKKQFCKQGSTVKDYGWLTDTRDNQVYKTVKIGDQTWMAENLNYVKPGEQSWCGGGEENYTAVEGDCAVYGRLYGWSTARSSCPSGWHLPRNAEWQTLYAAVAVSEETAAKVLKSRNLWEFEEGISNDDSFGFAALPAGERDHENGYFYDVSNRAYFWSADAYDGDARYAYYWMFKYLEDKVNGDYGFKNTGMSVRCLKN